MQLEHSFTVPVDAATAWEVLLDIPAIAPCMPGATLTSSDDEGFAGTVKVKLGPVNLTYKGTGRFLEKDADARKVVIEASGRDARGSGTAAATITASLRSESADATRVDVLTDLKITGRPAQFGRGVMVDVGGKLIGQFADCLAGKIAAGSVGGSSGAASSADGPGGSAGSGGDADSASSTTGSAGSSAVAAGPGTYATPDRPADQAPAPGSSEDRSAPAGRQATGALTTDPGRAEVEPIDLLALTGTGVIVRRYAPVVLAALFGGGVLVWLLRRRNR